MRMKQLHGFRIIYSKHHDVPALESVGTVCVILTYQHCLKKVGPITIRVLLFYSFLINSCSRCERYNCERGTVEARERRVGSVPKRTRACHGQTQWCR
jgi:hypothetical protein